MTTPEELANQIRSLCEQIDSKLDALKRMGFEDAAVYRNKHSGKMSLHASKTVKTNL